MEDDLKDLFASCSNGLKFTCERTWGGSLQFLDLKLKLLDDHICQAYEPRSKAGALPFISTHNKLVKRAITSSCLGAALEKSCPNEMGKSFLRQVDQLVNEGFFAEVLSRSCGGPNRKQ